MFKKFTDIKPIGKVRKIYEQDEVQAQGESENHVEEAPKANLPEVEQTNTECSPSKLFSKLFESREMAHIYHLQVKGDQGSYATHMALGSYYEGVLEFVDELVEVYQGQYDIIEDYELIDTKDTKSKDKIDYFKELVDFIKVERKCISEEDTHLHNIIDEVVALIYKTLYKLKFNK